MDLTLPDSTGWSGMHLVNKDWGSIAVIVKREWVIEGGSTTPADTVAGIVVADVVSIHDIDGEDTLVIEREAETALFKTRKDVLYLSSSTETPDAQGKQIITASLFVNDTERRRFTRGGATSTDPVNLFGYEPRTTRIAGGYDAETFDFPTEGAALFWSARRSDGFSVFGTDWDLSGSITLRVESRNADMDPADDPLALPEVTVDLPDITATPFVWEGGSNTPAHWCKRPALALVADTLTLDGDRVSAIWRGALPLASHPAADLRRIDIKEAA